MDRRTLLTSGIAAFALAGCASANPRPVDPQLVQELPPNSEVVNAELQLANAWSEFGSEFAAGIAQGHWLHAAAFATSMVGTPTPVPPTQGKGRDFGGLQNAEWLAAAQFGLRMAPANHPQLTLALAACHVYSTAVAQTQPKVSLAPVTSAPRSIKSQQLVDAFGTHLAALSAAPELLAGRGVTKADRKAGFEAIEKVAWLTDKLRSDLAAAGLPEIPEVMTAQVNPRPATVAQLREAYGNTANQIVATYGRWILSEPTKAIELASQMSSWQLRAIKWGQALPAWPGWPASSAV